MIRFCFACLARCYYFVGFKHPLPVARTVTWLRRWTRSFLLNGLTAVKVVEADIVVFNCPASDDERGPNPCL